MNLTEWRPVKGFEEKYEVSDDGRIRRIPHIVGNRVYKHREVKQNLSTNVASVILTGYDGRITTRFVKNIVAEAFVQKTDPSMKHVRYIDSKLPSGLLNEVSNLKWTKAHEKK